MIKYTYEIFEDGYDIYKYGKPYITQREPVTNLFVPAGNYEDNAKAQIEELLANEGPSLADKNRADIDFMALMLDVELPTEEEEE